MAGEGASTLIILTASLIVAAIVSSVIIATSIHLRTSIKERGEIEENYLKSKIEIINDEAYSPYNSTTDTLKLYVKNIGYTVLDMNHTVVLLNGTTYPLKYPVNIRPIGDSVWAPQVVVEINITVSPPLMNGYDYVATVISDYGVKDSIRFRV